MALKTTRETCFVLERLLLVQHFQHMPGNGFALAIRVGCQNERIGTLECLGYVLEPFVRCRVDFPRHGEILVGENRSILGRQVADVAERRQHLVLAAEILVDRFCLRRRFHYHYIHKIARTRPGLSAGRANSRRTDLAHEMYIEIDAVKPNGRTSPFRNPNTTNARLQPYCNLR
jgi:hypothetical protein